MTVVDAARRTAFVVALVGTGSQSAPVELVLHPFAWFSGGTSNGLQAAPPTPAAHAPSSRVSRVKVRWNLTWSQVAALFGVSRRAVHAWVAGGALHPRNLERLERIEEALGEGTASPDINHSQIFSGTPQAPSVYAQLLSEVRRDDGRRAADLLLGTVDAPLVAGRLLDGPEWQLPDR